MGSRGSGAAAAMVASFALALVLLLPGLGAAPFDDPGEGQHAEIAREIRASGDWLTLRLNGVRYLDKPPLLYWLAAGAFALFGDGEWAARLVPLGGAVLAAAATALLGARLLGPWAGLGAAGALLSSALFVVFGRYVRPETLFVAAIQWGLAGLLLGLAAPAERRSAPRLAPRGLRRARARLARQGSARAHRPARGRRAGPVTRRPTAGRRGCRGRAWPSS